jgi:hypothetical protein
MSDTIIGVVADMRRQQQAWALSNSVGATVLSYDDGTMGCTRNHIKVWTKVLQHGGDWGVVLEDDAMPCEGFKEQLHAALDAAPADIVGLYLGTGYPRAWQRFIKKAMASDAHYIMSSHVLHGVGTAIRMHLVPDMLRFVGNMSGAQQNWPIDEQITHWARLRGHRTCYTKPSIVEHADGESLLVHPDAEGRGSSGRELARHAWEFGERDTWVGDHWVEMP